MQRRAFRCGGSVTGFMGDILYNRNGSNKDGGGATGDRGERPARVINFDPDHLKPRVRRTSCSDCADSISEFTTAFREGIEQRDAISTYMMYKAQEIVKGSPMADMSFTEDMNGVSDFLMHVPTHAPAVFPFMHAADEKHIYTVGIVVTTDGNMSAYAPVIMRTDVESGVSESYDRGSWNYLPDMYDGYSGSVRDAANREGAGGRIARSMMDGGNSEQAIAEFMERNGTLIDIAEKCGDICSIIIIGGEAYLRPRNPRMGGCGIRQRDGTFEVCQVFHNEHYLNVFNSSSGNAFKSVNNMIYPVGTLTSEEETVDFINTNFDKYSPSGMWVIPLSEKTVVFHRVAVCSVEAMRAAVEKMKLSEKEAVAFENVIECINDSANEAD